MNVTIKAAALLGATAVGLGAFGAHGLQQHLDEKALHVYQTGVAYQFYHVFALLATGLLQLRADNNFLRWASNLFMVGILFFSGSLYVLSGLRYAGAEGYNFIGIITPFGGLMFIAGWLMLFLGASKKI